MPWASLEVLGEGFVIAQVSGAEVEHSLGILVVIPELFAPFDALVELLDPGLHRTAGNRQASAAITRVVHTHLVVGEVAMLTTEHTPRVLRFVVGLLGRRELTLPLFQFAEDLLDATLPAQRGPLSPQLGTRADGFGGGMNMFRCVDEIEDRLKLRKMAAVDRPVVGQAITDERLGGGREEPATVGGSRHHRAELLAVTQARQAGADKGLGSTVGWLWRRRWRCWRRFRSRSQGLFEAGGEIGLRVVGKRCVGHSQEDRGLGLAPCRLVDPGAMVGFSGLDPATVDHDDGQRHRGTCVGRGRHPRAFFEGFGRALPLSDEFAADLLAEGLKVPG